MLACDRFASGGGWRARLDLNLRPSAWKERPLQAALGP
jgi:hypothetical protein